MDQEILKSFETFDENPDGVLIVDKTSNLMYIKKNDKVFIAREFIKKIICDQENMTIFVDYYAVTDNSLITSIKIVKTISDNNIKYIKREGKTKIIPMNEYFKIINNDKYILDKKLIKDIEEEQIIKVKK